MKPSAWLLRLGLDALLVAIALFDHLVFLDNASPLQLALAIIGALALVLRRRWPWASLIFALPAVAFAAASVAALVALYSIAVKEPRRWLLIVAGLLFFVSSANAWWGVEPIQEALVAGIYSVMSAAAPIALGLLVRTSRELNERLHELDVARELERQHAEHEILTTERTRIAREMHDVVSHQVSLIAVQAGALQVGTNDEQVRNSAVTIRTLAANTLDELRQMVTVLRATGESAGQLEPQPTMHDLGDLIAASGIEVTTEIVVPEDLPATVQRALYRTVQESLTNIRKHAPGATARVSAQMIDNEIELRITNTPPVGDALSLPSAGHGLMGLRERAELLDGSLETESKPDGSFALTLRLPV